LVITGERYADSLAASEQWATTSGAMPDHAYDAEETAPAGLDLDTVLEACRGADLIDGIAAYYAGSVKIVAIEPEAATTLTVALRRRRSSRHPGGRDSRRFAGPRRVGELVFPLAQRYVDSVALVTDAAIVEAQRALWSGLRIVAEPGGASAFAALLSQAYRPRPGETVGVLVCGGNTTAVDFTR
jgi:threonine dehydratase